jgi:hypothetical protein
MPEKRRDPTVSARTLRRTEVKLLIRGDAISNQVHALKEQLTDRSNEINERLQTIIDDIAAIQKVIGVLARHSNVDVPVLSYPEQLKKLYAVEDTLKVDFRPARDFYGKEIPPKAL